MYRRYRSKIKAETQSLQGQIIWNKKESDVWKCLEPGTSSYPNMSKMWNMQDIPFSQAMRYHEGFVFGVALEMVREVSKTSFWELVHFHGWGISGGFNGVTNNEQKVYLAFSKSDREKFYIHHHYDLRTALQSVTLPKRFWTKVPYDTKYPTLVARTRGEKIQIKTWVPKHRSVSSKAQAV